MAKPGLEVCVGVPSERSAAVPDDTSEVSFYMPDDLSAFPPGFPDASELPTDSDDSWTEKEMIDRYSQFLIEMQATRPEILRGIRTFQVLQEGPRRWIQGDLHGLHACTEVVTELDEFWSHSWQLHPLTKYVSLLFASNGFPAFVVGTATALVPFTLFAAGILPWDRLCTLCGAAGYYFTLLLWRQRRKIFLDIACINQTDQTEKAEGLVSLGAFLKRSRSLLVLWDATLVSRLWCIFEMAAFLRSHGLDSQRKSFVICPIFSGLAYLVGNFGLCVLCSIFSYSLSLMPLFPWGGALISALAGPCLTSLMYVVLLHYRNVDTVQRQLQHFTIRDSSCACCPDNHLDPRSGERMFCDRSIILRCISEWFGSTDHFESVVRGRLRDALVEELANRTFVYWRIVQATSPILWMGLDLLTDNIVETPNIILSIILYWLIVVPNCVLLVLRLAYMAKLLCDGRFARALLAIGLVATGVLIFGTCFASQMVLLPFFLRQYMGPDPTKHMPAWVLSTVLHICIIGPCSLLLWHGLFVRLGKAEPILDSAAAAKRQSTLPTEAPTDLRDGSRVSVKTLENSAGTVRFVGQTEFAEGDWIGVELDQPLGKNDGSVKGKAYFSCKPNHGIFARAGNLVTIPSGSLPEKPQHATSESEASGPLVPLPTLAEAPEPVEENASKNDGMVMEEILAKPPPATSGDSFNALEATHELATRSHITKEMEDQFEEELMVFEARQLPETKMSMMVDDTVMKVQAAVAQDEAAPTQKKRRKRKARDPTGFGAFLRQKQAMDLSATFRDVANAATREWADLGDEARAAFRSSGNLPRSTQAPKKFHPEPFSSAVYSMQSKAAGMESREVYTVLWHVDWGQVKGEAFSNEDDADTKFDELDGGEYAAMLVDKAYNEIKYYGTRGKVQAEMEEYWKRHFKGSKALDQIKKKNQPKESSAAEVEVKDHALDESLAELRKDHWVSEEERADPVVFRWELDETRTKIEKCLCGDLFLPSPEKDKIGFLDLALERFDTVALKRDRTEGHVISVDKESRLCKVVFPEREGSARVGFQTLSSLMFQRRKTPDALRQLRAPDFFPPEEGDLHKVTMPSKTPAQRAHQEKAIPVETVWEDDDSGNFCWTYGNEELDVRAASTSCTASGKVAIPFRFIPSPDIKKMVENSEEEFKKFKDRKTPQGWCYQANFWRLLQTSGQCQLEVAATMANVAELTELASGKRRQGLTKRGAVCADPIRVRKRRPRVDVKCTGQAFLCKPGSRLGLLATNDFSLPYIS
ncbi:Clip1, partial [Symbiodinium sp. CCMP2456]